MHSWNPGPPPLCPDCGRSRADDNGRCVCGRKWYTGTNPLRLSAWQCQTGLAGVRRAKRTLALTRLAKTLEHDAA